METIDHQPSSGPPQTVGQCEGDWTEAELRLRATVIRHCRWLWTYDREYAEYAFDRAAREMPWLKLQRKVNK